MYDLRPAFTSVLLGVGLIAAAPPARATQGQQENLIPRHVLFGNPDRAAVKISPDGMRLSYLAPHNNVLNVWVQTVGQDDARPLTNATERPIRIYFWAHNSEQIIYAQDVAGNENFHLYAVNLENGSELDLTPFESIQARVLATDRDFPDEILVGINDRDPRLHDVWRINTRNGERQLVLENEGYVAFLADSRFQVRAGMRFLKDGGLVVFARDSDDQPWYELVHWTREDALTSGLQGFSRDGESIYLLDSRAGNTAQLYAYSMVGDEPTFDLIARSDRADISHVVFDPDTGRPQAVASEYTRREWKILDPAIQDDWNYLTNLRDGEMLVTSRSHDDMLWTVAYVRDDGPVEYFLYDRDAGEATFLFTNRSQLADYKLAKMKPIVITARDGLKLVSYLTTPLGTKPRNLPMVLLVHGGPWSRDAWGYNSLHQWLANRGYAVLSVNFRGSTGFGKRFVNAGDNEWAGAMHDDLIDAVNWAVDEKIADPDRVAIMGGSYGGYAALVGLTFTPEFFAAGVDIVGPSDVAALIEAIPPYWEPIKALFETRVGSLDDPEYLQSISPLSRVDAICRPLLIGQGKNDPRVKEAQSRMIVEAMQAKNLPVTYVVFPDEGHGFARPENSMAFFAISEVFLAQHLGGRFEPISDAVAKSSADIQAGAALIEGLGVDDTE
ncbi:MAG: S9 family peptidase [Planctomycetes bacterium]|nr:S9 family peptidase [Planctomycetota bacterium]